MKAFKDDLMPPKHTPIKCVYIDIDGTLLLSDGTYNASLIEWINDKHANGYQIYFWSARGWEYAYFHIIKLDLRYTGYMTKPSIIIDDWGQAWSQWTKVAKPSSLSVRPKASIEQGERRDG